MVLLCGGGRMLEDLCLADVQNETHSLVNFGEEVNKTLELEF